MTFSDIARRLTPAQQRALLWLPSDKDMARRNAGKITPSLLCLLDHKLAEIVNFGGWWFLTPLGAEVRKIVEQEARDA
jgi:hypothetical protein